MNAASPELLLDAFSQLGAMSAVLGGLAFASAATLLAAGVGTNDPRALGRPATFTAGAAVVSAVCLIVAALIWALMAVAAAGAGTGEGLPQQVEALNRPASLTFIGGVFLLFVSVGASGWIASRKLGVVTTVVAGIGGLAALFVISRFSD